jgi:hypothetical protein
MQALLDEFPIVPLESEDNMAPTAPERFAAIDKRIDGLHDEIRAISRPEWWPIRAYQLAIDHKGTSLILAIILCFGGGYFTFWLNHRADNFNNAVDARIKAVLGASGGVTEALRNVQSTTNETNTTLKTLQPFIRDVIDHQFESVSKLSPQALGERLPAVWHLLAVAQDEKFKIEPSITHDLSKKMLQIPASVEGYWPTSGALITAQSVIGKSEDFLRRVESLPDCPRPSGSHNFVGLHQQLDNCAMVLDGWALHDSEFNDVVVKYKGGALWPCPQNAYP